MQNGELNLLDVFIKSPLKVYYCTDLLGQKGELIYQGSGNFFPILVEV